jgi:signal transduction histidine kinase
VNLKLVFEEIESDTLPGGFVSTVYGDADRLAQVFSNLIDNATKYTPPNGEATVSAKLVGDWVEVRVMDSGPGIPPDELDRIFERFYQTDKSRRGGSGRGVGLGLAIAREIVQAHGGVISAYNLSERQLATGGLLEPGTQVSGSVFLVKLPLYKPGEATIAWRK